MNGLIMHYGPLGALLWPQVASSSVLSCEEKSLFCALTWDASPDGWAALGRWWSLSGSDWAPREPLLVGSWPAGWDVSEQPFREALSGTLVFKGFAQALDLQGTPACCGMTPQRRSPRSGRAARSLHRYSAAHYGSTWPLPRPMWTSCPITFLAPP